MLCSGARGFLLFVEMARLGAGQPALDFNDLPATTKSPN